MIHNAPALAPVAFSDPTYNREREDADLGKSDKKDDKSTWRVNGEIKVPQKPDAEFEKPILERRFGAPSFTLSRSSRKAFVPAHGLTAL